MKGLNPLVIFNGNSSGHERRLDHLFEGPSEKFEEEN